MREFDDWPVMRLFCMLSDAPCFRTHVCSLGVRDVWFSLFALPESCKTILPICVSGASEVSSNVCIRLAHRDQ